MTDRATVLHQEQIGDYVLELPSLRALWGVRMAGLDKYISLHTTKAAAKEAIRRYQATDKRRGRHSA